MQWYIYKNIHEKIMEIFQAILKQTKYVYVCVHNVYVCMYVYILYSVEFLFNFIIPCLY